MLTLLVLMADTCMCCLVGPSLRDQRDLLRVDHPRDSGTQSGDLRRDGAAIQWDTRTEIVFMIILDLVSYGIAAFLLLLVSASLGSMSSPIGHDATIL